MTVVHDSVPKVFISSTCEDLDIFREAARDAALKVGLMPILSENFPASGHAPPLETCLDEAARCDLLVVLVAHRYGWVPPNQPEDHHKSITWLECERAIEEGKEVIAFMVDDATTWPVEQYEQYQATLEIQKDPLDLDRLAAIKRNMKRLEAFKEWLRSRSIRGTFGNPDELRGEMIAAMNHWRMQALTQSTLSPANSVELADPSKSLRMLLHQTEFIDIRGLQVGSGRAHRISIDELYIPLTIQEGGASTAAQHAVELQETLIERKLVIIGDPGSGKTTFLRRIAHTLCQTLLGRDSDGARRKLGFEESPFPIFIRLFDLSEFIGQQRTEGKKQSPLSPTSPEWLLRYLARASEEFAWGLPEAFFRDRFQAGKAILLFDGLDEAPTESSRQALTKLLENVADAYEDCRCVVTSRPKAYVGEVIMNSFESVHVAPLTEEGVQVFINLWCERLFPEAPELADSHRRELKEALKTRLEIRRMATNPVMLTALAVVHWNEKRIPEQRAELYESIVTWLSRARQARPGRLNAEKCVALLQKIAMAMQSHEDGRQVQVRRHWAAEIIKDEFQASGESESGKSDAECFLTEEELDSGIIVGRGDDIRFWHLSFQEFLAARALSGMSETGQQEVILGRPEELVSPEWRETILLFSGVLYRQGVEKVDAMFSRIVYSHAIESDFSGKARLVGLLGEISRDLSPLGYRYEDSEYLSMLNDVMDMFRADVAADVAFDIRLEAANALGQAGDPRLGRDRWIAISAGPFTMGGQDEDPDGHGYDPYALVTERPPHQVVVSEFEIARYPLSVQEFRQFVDAGGYQDDRYWQQGGYCQWEEPAGWESQVRNPNHPVVGISWLEAFAYSRWAGDSISLPTEAQWERAARGTKGRRYPWGKAPPSEDLCNFSESSIGTTTPVGFFQAGGTPEGVQDLAGNVFEWCLDRCLSYQESMRSPPGQCRVDDAEYRAVRGGCFDSSGNFIRTGFRGRYPCDFRSKTVGFRLCRSAPDVVAQPAIHPTS